MGKILRVATVKKFQQHTAVDRNATLQKVHDNKHYNLMDNIEQK